jgi:hypothetical protein
MKLGLVTLMCQFSDKKTCRSLASDWEHDGLIAPRERISPFEPLAGALLTELETKASRHQEALATLPKLAMIEQTGRRWLQAEGYRAELLVRCELPDTAIAQWASMSAIEIARGQKARRSSCARRCHWQGSIKRPVEIKPPDTAQNHLGKVGSRPLNPSGAQVAVISSCSMQTMPSAQGLGNALVLELCVFRPEWRWRAGI